MKFLRDFARTGGVADPEATDIDRRAQDVVKFGVIKEVDYKKEPPVYRVGIGDEKDEDNYILSDWLPAGGARAKGDRETHFLEKGEKVVLLAEGGELATAIVLPAGLYNPQNEDEKPVADREGVWRKQFKNGAEISYDRHEKKWLIDGTTEGEAVIKAGGCTITMKGGNVTIDAATVEVNGSSNVTLKSAKVATDGPTYLVNPNAKKKVLMEGLLKALKLYVEPPGDMDEKAKEIEDKADAAAAAAGGSGGSA